MSKRIISIVLSLIMVCLIPGQIGYTGENKLLARIVMSAVSLCQSAYICWEKVPDALTFIVKRDNVEIAKLSSEVNYYVDCDAKLTEGSQHFYKVIAEDSNEVPIAESISANTTNICFNEEDCYSKLEFTIDSYMYRVDGEMLGPMDAPPMIIRGRTFLVIRYITEAIGAKIGWDGTQRKVTITTKAGDIIDLWIGKPTAQINGKDIEIDPGNPDVVPEIVNNRTLLPLRFVGEQLGAKGENGIVWHAAEKKIEMNIFDETCIPPFEWWLTVVSVDRVMGTLVCKDSFGIEFDLIMDVSFPSDIKEGSRVIVNGPVNQTGLGERLKITCKGITLIETPENTEKIIGKIISIDCDGTKTKIVILKPNGEEQEATIKGSALCGLSEDTWITVDVDEDGVVSDWGFVIDQIIEESSEEFGPILMKVLAVDLKEKIIRCNKPDDFHKDWRRAEEHAYRFINPELVTDIEDHRCYNIWYSRNHMNKEFLTKIERVPCPALFDLEFTRTPEKVSSGVGEKIKVKITNNNEFPRVYTPIFRSETFDGYFKPNKDSIEIYPGESDLFSMNFASSYNLEGIVTFEVGAACDDVEVVETFEILFKKPRIEIEKMPYVIKMRKGRTDQFFFKVMNHGLEKVRVNNYADPLDFPGEVWPAADYYRILPNDNKEFGIKVRWNDDVVLGSKHLIEYGASIAEYVDKSSVMIQCISDVYPEIEGKFYYSEGSLEVRFEGEINWKGLEPLSLSFDWDDYVGWDERRMLGLDAVVWEEHDDFPVTHTFNLSGHHMVIAKAEAKTGETGFAYAWVRRLDGRQPEPYITDIKWNEKEPCKFKIDGFINWDRLDEGKMATFWDDDVVTYGLPCEYISKRVAYLHSGTMFTKAESGEQTYRGLNLWGYNSPIRIPRFETFDLKSDESDILLARFMHERIKRREKIDYINCSVMYPGDVSFTKGDISRRPGGRHTN